MKTSSKTSKWHSYEGWLKLDRQVVRGEKANYKVDVTPKFHIKQTKAREGFKLVERPTDYIERCKALCPALNPTTLRRKYKALIHDNVPSEEDYDEDFLMMGDYIGEMGDR